MAILPKAIYRINAITTKIPMTFFPYIVYFLLYFFHYYLTLYTSIPPAITTLFSVFMCFLSLFFLCLFPLPIYQAPYPSQLSSCSLSLSLFCLLVHFVHQISHISEIIWYLSFSDWLISLSIMFSRSIHAVRKGKIFFFLCHSSIPLCKCSIVVLSTHLLMDTWAASKAWQL